jgi:hypothetical protein
MLRKCSVSLPELENARPAGPRAGTPEARVINVARRHGRDRHRDPYTREAPGMSAFALEDRVMFHTYSAYAG